jgi:hypothetical protein
MTVLMLRGLIGPAIGLSAFCLASGVGAETRCACPQIPAIGVGNTSCSAAESGGRCTVDFNLFGPDREGRAAELLAGSGVSGLIRPDPNADAVNGLLNAASSGPGALRDTVLLYLMVSRADMDATPGAIIRSIGTSFRENAALGEAINESFGRGAIEDYTHTSDAALLRSFRMRRIELPDLGVATFSPGCTEIAGRGLWVMFKAAWAAARLSPRCEGPRP